MNARKKEKAQSLQDNIEAIEIHLQHIENIMKRLQPLFPITAEKIEQLSFDEILLCDGLIYRFTHIQDTLAGKVFASFLDTIKEQPDGPGFIDKLNLLERLEIIENAYQWIDLRDLRNDLSHEYINKSEMQADFLNKVERSRPVFISTFDRIKKRLAQ